MGSVITESVKGQGSAPWCCGSNLPLDGAQVQIAKDGTIQGNLVQKSKGTGKGVALKKGAGGHCAKVQGEQGERSLVKWGFIPQIPEVVSRRWKGRQGLNPDVHSFSC